MIDRDDLLQRIDLAALLDELSPGPPTRLGNNARWRCINPGHDDHHPSVTMFTDRRGIQRWRCWSGGHGGTAIDAIHIAHGTTIADAIHELEQRAGLPITGEPRHIRPVSAASEARAIDPAVLDYVAACERILWRPTGRAVLDYFVIERGLAPDVLEANHVGADPGPGTLKRAAGLPRGGPAAVLPSLDRHGTITYVQARYLNPTEHRPKYDNPASRLATNPRLTWTIPTRNRHPNRLLVCEGVIDALTAASHGFPAVAVLGATYVDNHTATQIAVGAASREIVVLFDGDPAGNNAAHTLTALLTKQGVTSHVEPLPAGRDLNSVQRRDKTWIRDHLAAPTHAKSLGRDLARTN